MSTIDSGDVVVQNIDNPCLTRDSNGNLHVVYVMLDTGTYYLYHKSSDDDGTTWSSTHTIDSSSYSIQQPVIAVDSSDDLHVVYVEYDTVSNYDTTYMKSSNGGSSWGSSQVLWDGSSVGNTTRPNVVVDENDNIFVIVERDNSGTTGIYCRYYDSSWQSEETVHYVVSQDQSQPNAAVGPDNTIHVVFMGEWTGYLGRWNIRYNSRSALPGGSWGTTSNLTTNSDSDATDPSLTIDGNGVVWYAYRYYLQIFMDNDGGLDTYNTTGDSRLYSSLSRMQNNNIRCIWWNSTDDTIEYVLYTASTDSWGTPSTLVSGITANPAHAPPRVADAFWPLNQVNPYAGIYFVYGNFNSSPPNELLIYYGTEDLEWECADTAQLTDYAYRLFAHRAVSNASIYDDQDAAPISHMRFYDASGDYIQVPVLRNYNDDNNPIFDDTGGSEADPEYTAVTQYYRDLDLAIEVPRFNKMYDVSANEWTYATTPFTVTDYELFNGGGNVIAEPVDTDMSIEFAEGTRYIVRFKIRVFNDMVEQSLGENTRCVITEDGLKTIIRRVLLDNSPQENAKPPMCLGIGATGGYHYSSGSDIRWRFTYPSTYSAITDGTDMFPSSSAEGDAFVYLREESNDDDIEGMEFTLSVKAVPSDATSLVWEYYDLDGNWTQLNGVEDHTEMFQYDGKVTWEVPMDIDPAAQVQGSNVGRYYRCRIVGGGFTTEPRCSDISEHAVGLCLRTLHTETDLQTPLNRKLADLIITPATGHSAKVSATFGLGGLVERTRDNDGTLLSSTYEPVREVGLFTTIGKVESEEIPLGSYTGTVSSHSISIPTATNPEPIKLFNAIKSDGLLYNVSEKFMPFTETGGNYVTSVPLPNGTYTLTYLGKDITPSDSNVENILAVYGNVQNLSGPHTVWTYAHDETPADSDSGADTFLTPKYIAMKGMPMAHSSTGEGALSPNFLKDPSDRGVVVSATDFGLASYKGYKIKRGGLTNLGGLMGNNNVWDIAGYSNTAGPFDDIKYTFTAGYPMLMCRFNVMDYDRLNDPILVVTATGFSKAPEGESQFSYDVLLWSEGDPQAQDAHDRETGWKLLQSSQPVPGGSRAPETVTVTIPMRYKEDGGYISSPYVDEAGDMFILVVSCKKNTKDGKWKPKTDIWSEVSWDRFINVGGALTGRMTKRAKRYFGDIGLSYIGLVSNPVGDAGKSAFSFRRGVDWTYILGDDHADWRIDGTIGDGIEPADYVVTTNAGVAHIPVLPTAKIGMKTEYYYFGAAPATATDSVYTQYQPIPGSVFMWMENDEKRITSANKKITIDFVGWDSDAIWNDRDADYSDDHAQATSGGEGAGTIGFTFDSKYWSASENRNVGVRYLYYQEPSLRMDYLRPSGKLFARAHFSDVSHSTMLQPSYGDRMRIYFEIQFEPKRSA